jgi:hypothetical protein
MAFDVPFLVGGGAEHNAEVFRRLAYAATQGAEGVVSPGDFKITALGVPGGAVTIAAGSAHLLNRSVGGAQQTYSFGRPDAFDVPIAPTTAAGPRSDLVIIDVEDPQYSPWQTPGTPGRPGTVKAGPYVYGRVLSGVPATTRTAKELNLGYPAIALARIDIPASTGAITAAMITDLRKLGQPRSHRETASTGFATAAATTVTTEVYTRWLTQFQPSILIPEWATECNIFVHMSGVVRTGGPVGTELRVLFGSGVSGGEILEFDSEPAPAANSTGREAFTLTGGAFFTAAERGTVQDVVVEGRILFPASFPGRLRVEDGSQAAVDVQFYERAV